MTLVCRGSQAAQASRSYWSATIHNLQTEGQTTGIMWVCLNQVGDAKQSEMRKYLKWQLKLSLGEVSTSGFSRFHQTFCILCLLRVANLFGFISTKIRVYISQEFHACLPDPTFYFSRWYIVQSTRTVNTITNSGFAFRCKHRGPCLP